MSGPRGRVPVAVESASRLPSQSLFPPSSFFLGDLELPFSGGLSKCNFEICGLAQIFPLFGPYFMTA